MQPLFLLIITQIITESFPISSSSHMKIVQALLNYSKGCFVLLPPYFDDFLHGPTVLVLAFFFWHRWFFLISHPIRTRHLLLPIIGRTAIAVTASLFLYLLFCVNWQMVYSFPLSLGLCVTMVLLFSLRFTEKKYVPYTYSTALLLGIVQGVALLPGISRLAATYAAARWLKLSPRHAFEASFAMQVPLLIAAFLRAVLYYLSCPSFGQLITFNYLLVMFLSGIVAYGALFLVFSLGKAHRLWWLWLYMIIPLVSVWIMGVP